MSNFNGKKFVLNVWLIGMILFFLYMYNQLFVIFQIGWVYVVKYKMLYIEILVKLGINVEELFYDLGMYVLNVVIEVGEYSFIYIYVYNDNMKLFLY